MDKYGDELYKFAFILTGTDKDAAEVFSDAFAQAAANGLLSGRDEEDRELMFAQIYKTASKLKTTAEYDGKYGKKSDAFYEMMKMPLRERAFYHLTEYENMTEQKANGVIGKK